MTKRLLSFAVLLVFALPAVVFAAPAPVAARLITHGARDHRWVALTFDVCQKPSRPAGFDRHLVEILRREHIPATFFLGGDWMRTHQEQTRLLASAPFFALGNHSWSHPDFRRLSDAAMRSEIRRTQQELFRLTGRRGQLFRLPYGTYNQRVLDVIAGEGVRTIQWEVVSGDPDPHVTAARILRAVPVEVRPGSIVIMHANGRGWHTAEALPGVIRALRKRGFTFVTVPELLGLSKAK